MKIMLYWLIPVGVILVLSIIILVGIILESNQLVILKNNVDRKFPLMNMKLKEYREIVKDIINFSSKKEEDRKLFLQVQKNYNKIKTSEGIFQKMKAYELLRKNVATLMKDLNKEEKMDENKKYISFCENLKKIEKQISDLKTRYNESAEIYNKKLKSFPARVIAKRFKFEEKPLW